MKVVWSDARHHLTLQRAWETALERTGWILAGRPDATEKVAPVQCRFHELRHTAISRMIANKDPHPDHCGPRGLESHDDVGDGAAIRSLRHRYAARARRRHLPRREF
jgi:hypothetical protein